MKVTLASLAILASSSFVVAQGVTEAIAPTGSAPNDCTDNYVGQFHISARPILSEKRSLDDKRQLSGILTLTLEDSILLDQANRTGYIASNFQFQFDAPPQAGSIYTAGFSVCTNGSLALGGSTVWYQCLSGNFYNLYDRHWAAQCEPIVIVIAPLNEFAGPTSGIELSATTPVTGGGNTATATGATTLTTSPASNSAVTLSESGSSDTTVPTGASSGGASSGSEPTTTSGEGTQSSAEATGAATGAASSNTSTGAAATVTPIARAGALAVGLVGAAILL